MPRATVQSTIERRRHQLEQADEMTVRHSSVEGWAAVDGAGEAVVDVKFPVLFCERPVFTFGHELSDNVWPTQGAFPTVSATVVTWSFVTRGPTKRYWDGARLAVVVGGPDGMHSLLHYSFAGKAFRNPVLPDTGTNEPI